MSKLTVPEKGQRLSSNQRQRLLGWLPVKQEILMANHKMTYKLINDNTPEELASVMPLNTEALRIKDKKKLGTKPSWLSKSKVAKSSYRGRAYTNNILPHYLTTEPKYSKFKTNIKIYTTRTLGAYGPLVLEYGDCFFVVVFFVSLSFLSFLSFLYF